VVKGKNMRVYFASDFHLKFTKKNIDTEQYNKIISFLDSIIGNADLLILNGDIFDLWFVWKTVIIKGYFPILKKMADLRENGCRIVFIAGNHDFWFRDFLTDFLDVEVYPDSFSETIDGMKIFVSHGDLFTTNDARYKIFRSLIRNNFFKKIFELFHPDFSLALGILLSRSSRDRKSHPELERKKEEGLTKFAKHKLQDYDLVVLGHSHAPKLIKYENGYHANAGDWVAHQSYLKMIDGKLELCEYS